MTRLKNILYEAQKAFMSGLNQFILGVIRAQQNRIKCFI